MFVLNQKCPNMSNENYGGGPALYMIFKQNSEWRHPLVEYYSRLLFFHSTTFTSQNMMSTTPSAGGGGGGDHQTKENKENKTQRKRTSPETPETFTKVKTKQQKQNMEANTPSERGVVTQTWIDLVWQATPTQAAASDTSWQA